MAELILLVPIMHLLQAIRMKICQDSTGKILIVFVEIQQLFQ